MGRARLTFTTGLSNTLVCLRSGWAAADLRTASRACNRCERLYPSAQGALHDGWMMARRRAGAQTRSALNPQETALVGVVKPDDDTIAFKSASESPSTARSTVRGNVSSISTAQAPAISPPATETIVATAKPRDKSSRSVTPVQPRVAATSDPALLSTFQSPDESAPHSRSLSGSLAVHDQDVVHDDNAYGCEGLGT